MKNEKSSAEETSEGVEEESEAVDYDWENLESEEASKVFKALEGIIPDIIKKTVVAGVGNILLSEDGIRNLVADKKLPKEAVGFILNQGDAMRKEILRIISREIKVFLENMDFGGEIAKILTTLSFEIKTEVRFIPNEERVVPQVRNRMKVKRNDKVVADSAKTKSEDDSSEKEDEIKVEKKPKVSRWRRGASADEEE